MTKDGQMDEFESVVISRHDFVRFVKECTDLLNSAAPLPPIAPQPADATEGASIGELMAVHELTLRVKKHACELHPLPADKETPRARRNSQGSQDVSQTAATLIPAIRSTLHEIEDRLAEFLPHRSSGTLVYVFHGKKKMTRADGDAIRAQCMLSGREAVFRKWCFPGERGYPEGQGEYSKTQVTAALSHDVGKHRRRQRHTNSVSPPHALGSSGAD